ncbi:MAG: tetratricopeptide repeat protein [Bacteroidia bacterium]
MEKNTKIESRISIVVAFHNIEKDIKQFESLFATVNKSKSDVELVLVDRNSTDSSVSKIESDKTFAELVNKSKLKFLKSKEKKSIGTVYAEALNLASGNYSLIVQDLNYTGIGNLISWISSSKKNIGDDEIFAGSNGLKASVNKNSGTQKWMNKFYNSWIRFFTPLNLKDNNSGVIACKTEPAAKLFEMKLACANDHLDVLYLASCNGIAVKEFPINTDKTSKKNSIGSILSVPFTAFRLRWNYFISASLHELRSPKKISLLQTNHPVYRFAFFALILMASFAMPYLSRDFGMTWDEKQHNDYAQLSYKWFTTTGDDSAAIAEPAGSADFIRQAYRFYGEQCNIIAAIVYNTFDLPQFETRHFIISLYGLLGLICIALAAKEIAGWRAGILAILFTFFNPGWLGNSMNNPTDIPFATGFAVSMYYLIKILKGLPSPKRTHLVWLAIGVGIAIGSRIGGLLILAYLGLFMGIQWLLLNRDKTVKVAKLILPYLKIFLFVALLGYILGIILWPYAMHNPFKNPFLAFKKASDNSFYTNNVEIFEGKRLYMLTQAPWYYVIKFLSYGNPIYLLLGFILPIPLMSWMKKKMNIGFVFMLIFMVVFPIVYAEVSKINHYNGWRHYLFILPSWLALSAVSFEFLIGQKNKIIAFGSLAVLLVLFAKPTFWIIKNHPNEYVYFNELIGGINGAYGSYETDYYSNSCRAAGEWIAKQEPGKKLVVAINNEPLTASYYANKINPDLQFQWVREYEEQKPRWDYMILTSRTFSQHELLHGSFPPKGTVHIVKADDVPLAVVVKRENYFMPDGYKYNDAKNADSAIYFFTKAVEYAPNDEEANRMLGQAYLNKGSLDTAEKYFDKAIEIYPENFSAWSNKGMIYLNKKEYDKAIPFFKKAVTFKRNFTEAYYFAAMCELSRNNYNGAIPFLEDAVKNNGQAPEIYHNLGISYLNIGNLNKAEQAFLNALSMNPKLAQSYLGLAETYKRLNKTEEANECLRRAQQLGAQ